MHIQKPYTGTHNIRARLNVVHNLYTEEACRQTIFVEDKKQKSNEKFYNNTWWLVVHRYRCMGYRRTIWYSKNETKDNIKKKYKTMYLYKTCVIMYIRVSSVIHT